MEKIEGLTLNRPLPFLTDQKITTWYDARILAMILIMVMMVLYIFFR